MLQRSILHLALFLCLVISGNGEPKKPNILLIVADDLGYSDLGCYGGEIETPNLDALATNGARLTRFYNTGRCCPSRAAILTGQYPHRVGLGHMTQDIGQPGYRGKVSVDAETIAEVLTDKNYRSFIAGKWHLGTPNPTLHGFEEFYGTLVSAKTFWDPDHYIRLPADRTKREYQKADFYGTDAVTDHALDFLKLARDTPDGPWFLYLAYHAPHFPLQAPAGDIAKYAGKFEDGWDAARERRLKRMKEIGIVPESTPLTPRSRWWNFGETNSGENPPWSSLPEDRRKDLAHRMAIYAAMIDRMDQNIGRVLEDLREKGELENTLIVFTSDNGACAEWDPHGFDIKSSNHNILHKGDRIWDMGKEGTFHSAGSGWANASNTPWRLQKHFNHEGGIASPCIVHWPAGDLQKGAIFDQPSHIIDLLPTFVDCSNAKYQGRIPLPGESLLPLLKKGKNSPRTLYFEHEGNRAIIDGSWKMVALRDEPWELYQTDYDRSELNDLADRSPVRVAQLSRRWSEWAKENFVTPIPKDHNVPYLKRAGTNPTVYRDSFDKPHSAKRVFETGAWRFEGGVATYRDPNIRGESANEEEDADERLERTSREADRSGPPLKYLTQFTNATVGFSLKLGGNDGEFSFHFDGKGIPGATATFSEKKWWIHFFPDPRVLRRDGTHFDVDPDWMATNDGWIHLTITMQRDEFILQANDHGVSFKHPNFSLPKESISFEFFSSPVELKDFSITTF